MYEAERGILHALLDILHDRGLLDELTCDKAVRLLNSRAVLPELLNFGCAAGEEKAGGHTGNSQ